VADGDLVIDTGRPVVTDDGLDVRVQPPPRPLTKLIGRERELTALHAVADVHRLLTLTGPPGPLLLLIDDLRAIGSSIGDAAAAAGMS
jgi:hypothetical protein